MPSERIYNAAFKPSNFSTMRAPASGGKGGDGAMTRPSGPADHLTGAAKSTYETLKVHDGIKGTKCAQGYLDLINAAQAQYEDDMRIASLQSDASIVPTMKGVPKVSKRSLLEAGAKATKLKSEGQALGWATDCMQGKVEAGPSEGTTSTSTATGFPIAQGVSAGRGVVSQAQLKAIGAGALSSHASPMKGQGMGPSAGEVEQAALDADSKKKKLILYAVLGLGVAGAAFYFIRLRKA